MTQAAMVYPMAALVFMTLGILISLPVLRIMLVRQRKVPANYFRYNRGAKLPDYLIGVEQNFDNLLQTPVLFYALGILLITLQQVEPWYVTMAWVYVAARMVHSIIHISYNRVLDRFIVFAFSVLVLGVMWGRLLIDLLAV